MDDALHTAGDGIAMQGSLSADLAALVAAGELDAEEAADMLAWLGLPELETA